ncbi:MAG: VanZ family protein [Pseudonocardia sp.]
MDVIGMVVLPAGGVAMGFVVVGVAPALLPGAWRAWVTAPLACAAVALVVLVTVVVRTKAYPPAGWWLWEVWQVAQFGTLSLVGLREQLNVLMLVPFAWFATLTLARPALAAAAGVLLSCVVEYVQGATGVGATQLSDLVHNSAGSVLGAGSAYLLLRASDHVLRGRRSATAQGRGRRAGD